MNKGDKGACPAKSEHDQLIKEIDRLTTALYEKDNEISEFQSQLNDKDEIISMLHSDIAARDEEIKKLKENNINWKARMDEKIESERVMRAKGNKCLNELTSLQDRMDKQSEQVKLLQSQLKGAA